MCTECGCMGAAAYASTGGGAARVRSVGAAAYASTGGGSAHLRSVGAAGLSTLACPLIRVAVSLNPLNPNPECKSVLHGEYPRSAKITRII